MYRWNDVPGVCVVEVDEDFALLNESFYAGDTLEIHFTSSGYWMQASMYGGPDNLGWPAEQEDERIATHFFVNDLKVDSPELVEAISERYWREIQATELKGL